MILLVDNYDSFAHNLARYLRRLGQMVCVLRNDVLPIHQFVARPPDAIVLSPGPCTPQEAGQSLQLVQALAHRVPMLGVCLGHQTLAAACGAKIVRASEPMHGRTSPVWHDGQGIFHGLPDPLVACRYHSLVVDADSLPAELRVTAHSPDGAIMGLEHRTWPLFGVQFHPESILTEYGYPLLANFLDAAKLKRADTMPTLANERQLPARPDFPVPVFPLTF